MDLLDVSLINWSRAQFALTAMYHWLFVPLTLGLGIIQAIMETIYVKTGKEEWKNAAKFWMTVFGINFAIGVATGIILEFQFGTNWSNYSWFVGDIFGAPLAIEGIVAFFMEATFISIMFFGWKKVSKGVHLASTWLTITGATLSALWILVANAWMQLPLGMQFNPTTVRNEMIDFWAIISSPVAINKFIHAVTSGWVLSGLFVMGISAWYLIKKREVDFAKKSIRVASIFGLVGSAILIYTGDGSAYQVAQHQPMKLAVMEGVYKGQNGNPLTVIGIVNPNKKAYNDDVKPVVGAIKIPKLLSFLGYRDANAFVPGIVDIVDGGYTLQDGKKALSFNEKKARGQAAITALKEYKAAEAKKDQAGMIASKAKLDENYQYFGYGYLKSPEDLIPNVPLVFYSFHVMVGLGFLFLLLFIVVLYAERKDLLMKNRWLLWISLWSIPLGYLASQMGWIVAEVGRQPWTIQDILPVQAAVSSLQTSSVKITFFLFAVLFTVLAIAEVSIMVKQIKNGPQSELEK